MSKWVSLTNPTASGKENEEAKPTCLALSDKAEVAFGKINRTFVPQLLHWGEGEIFLKYNPGFRLPASGFRLPVSGFRLLFLGRYLSRIGPWCFPAPYFCFISLLLPLLISSLLSQPSRAISVFLSLCTDIPSSFSIHKEGRVLWLSFIFNV